MELWKDIEGFENYQVSSWGRVRSANGILKPYKNKKGYLKVGLTKTMYTMAQKYSINWIFCSPYESAEKIVELLTGEENGKST